MDNDHNVINMESNRRLNGKLVGEPKPNEAVGNNYLFSLFVIFLF